MVGPCCWSSLSNASKEISTSSCSVVFNVVWYRSNSPLHDSDLLHPGNQTITLHWRHNDKRWRLKSPASRLFTQSFIQAQIKETSKLRVTGLCVGNSPGPVNSPHKGPVTRKIFPFDDVIMIKRSNPAEYEQIDRMNRLGTHHMTTTTVISI